ncbi:MAG: CocE/NonD family hydrolase [Pirellulaceae bacterium]
MVVRSYFARVFTWLVVLVGLALIANAQEAATRAEKIRAGYAKFEYQVPMRDGVKLFTACYIPNDAGPNTTYPILLLRTPYSVGPYGADQYRTTLGPSEAFEDSGYIFVYQDVRGRYLSEGEFDNMRPHVEGKRDQQTDESSDTYDTIEWLLKKLEFHNGRVGQWGISYPGFYTSAGAIDSHPGLKCISPQAPIADWFWDDMHRNGAFNLQLAVGFFSSFGHSRPQPSLARHESLDLKTDDAYQFFLDLGALRNVNEQHFNDKIAFWNDITQHPNYDTFWQSRNLLPHLKNVRCACLVVGGLFDTEDLYGPLKTYQAIEQLNPQIQNSLVMGPWFHGGWNRTAGDVLGDARFDWATAQWYRDEIEFPFFEHHLKAAENPGIAEATVFETGANRWRKFSAWPPRESEKRSLFLASDQRLLWSVDAQSDDTERADTQASDTYISDPRKPVPYTMEITGRWAKDYMAEDQRFAARRPDVLVYRSEILEADVTIAGPLLADMWFSTTGTDADLVVKLIDEFPGRIDNGSSTPPENFQSGRQQLVRGQVMRLRFRESFEQPQPLVPGQVENTQFELHDILHTFKRGHRIMIQVQSSWFPFVDRNPQRYVENIFEASEDDYISAEHTIHRDPQHASSLHFEVLP